MSTSAFVEGWDTRWKQKFSSTSSCLFGWEIQTCYPSENNISLQAVCNVYAHNGVCRWKCKQKRPLQNQLSLLAVHLLINSHTWVTQPHIYSICMHVRMQITLMCIAECYKSRRYRWKTNCQNVQKLAKQRHSVEQLVGLSELFEFSELS